MNKKAVVLASGGVDSSTVLKLVESQGYDIYVLSFDYGQKHKIELNYLDKFLKTIRYIEHKNALIDMRLFGGSSLTSDSLVPSFNSVMQDIKNHIIPNTYVPARNTIFLSYALAYAEIVQASKIFIGTYSVDYLDYPDCKESFIEQFNQLIKFAINPTISNFISVEAPYINLSKVDIIKNGLELGVDYSLSFSCYDPSIDEKACGKCSACHFRLNAFEKLGMKDPIAYKE